MSVSLQKGQKVSLTKDNGSLNRVIIGLGWDQVKQSKGGFAGLFAAKPGNVDCDASALVLSNGSLVGKEDIVFFRNLKHRSGAIQHLGDNLTGAGDGDDEQIVLELAQIPQQYDRIVIVVNIYDAVGRKQHFGMIQNAFCRIIDARTNQELCRYNLSENYNGMTAMIFGEVYRHDNEWKFNAIGQGTTDTDLGQLAMKYQR